MFTGIIQGTGTVKRLTAQGMDAILHIDAAISLEDTKIGDSIAINGVCLTVTSKTANSFSADVSAETLSKTNLNSLKSGAIVNLEKALKLNDFLGGHIVLGHVDAIGRISGKNKKANSVIFGIEITEQLMRYVVEKGSVAIDGISLTVNSCEKKVFYVNIIPHTIQATTLAFKTTGDQVNVETDILGKYVEKLIGINRDSAAGLDMAFLAKHGYIK